MLLLLLQGYLESAFKGCIKGHDGKTYGIGQALLSRLDSQGCTSSLSWECADHASN